MFTKPRPSTPCDLATAYRARATSALTSYADTSPSVEEPVDLPQYWTGVIGLEGELTGDGRLIEEGALEWATPIPLRFVMEDVGAHDGAVTVGRILSITRGENGEIQAAGDFDLGSDVGREAARVVNAEVLNGVSMDLDSVAFEVRMAREVYDEIQAFWEAIDEEGEPAEEEIETDSEGRVVIAKLSPDQELMVTTAARVRGATLVSIPAFATAKIAASTEAPESVVQALVASGAPVDPPEAWFFRPEADGPTALTITDDGQVYGHLATWDTCHVADPSGAGVCVMAPKNKTGYSFFHVGAVKTAEGTLVPTGPLTFNTGHASMRSNAADAAAHYDHTGFAGADIHVIDGKHGIWVSGALRPSVTDEQLRTLRASPLSGDWRWIDGQLELVGALAVNLPGFPVPRTKGLVASGAMTSMVSAGVIANPAALQAKQFSDADAAVLQKLIDRERLHDQRQLAARVRAARAERQIEKLAADRARARAKAGI